MLGKSIWDANGDLRPPSDVFILFVLEPPSPLSDLRLFLSPLLGMIDLSHHLLLFVATSFILHPSLVLSSTFAACTLKVLPNTEITDDERTAR
jgi:hypothetical protein